MKFGNDKGNAEKARHQSVDLRLRHKYVLLWFWYVFMYFAWVWWIISCIQHQSFYDKYVLFHRGYISQKGK